MLKFVLLKLFFLTSCAIALKNNREYRNSHVSIANDEVSVKVDVDSVSFFVLGDWGGLPVYPYRTLIEQSTSSLMTTLSKSHDTQFQLALGDNFYFNGVHDVNDKRFQETYEDVFNSEYLEDTPWFVLLGNHDHYGNASAQLDYTSRSKRWVFPSYNYTIDVLVGENATNLVSILMIDTVLMCGNTGYDWETEKTPRYETIKEKIMSEKYFIAVEERLRMLADSGVMYVIVAGHFPVWSIAEHGPTQCLVDRLRPLLHKYKVSAYLCGHDHNLQLITDTYLNETVQYIVSGASNFIENSTKHINDIPKGSLKFHWADETKMINGGFCVVDATSQNMTITFIETTGKELYQTVIYPRKVKHNQVY